MRGGHATGGEGNDVLVGSSVAPSALHGDSGNDRIKAGAGGATIGGGADADKLFANSGEDLFVFTAGFGRDNLYGLDVENDRIAVAIAGVESGDLMFRSMNGGQDTLVTFRGVESSTRSSCTTSTSPTSKWLRTTCSSSARDRETGREIPAPPDGSVPSRRPARLRPRRVSGVARMRRA